MEMFGRRYPSFPWGQLEDLIYGWKHQTRGNDTVRVMVQLPRVRVKLQFIQRT